MPGAIRSSAGVLRPRSPVDRAITASVRRHASRERWAIRRPRERTWRWAASASASPRRSASGPHISGAMRSAGRPARSCTSSRTSRSICRAASSAGVEASTSQLASIALSTPASRSPPSASLTSGTDAWASSPVTSWRLSVIALSSGSRVRAWRRQSASIVVRSRRLRPGSPARWRASSRPSATRRSVAASSTSLIERTEWSSRRPESHSGYQSVARQVAEVEAVLVDQDDVEVGVRRELAAAVAPDRDQGHPGDGPAGGGVRLPAELVGRGGPGLSLCCGHACTSP